MINTYFVYMIASFSILGTAVVINIIMLAAWRAKIFINDESTYHHKPWWFPKIFKIDGYEDAKFFTLIKLPISIITISLTWPIAYPVLIFIAVVYYLRHRKRLSKKRQFDL